MKCTLAPLEYAAGAYLLLLDVAFHLDEVLIGVQHQLGGGGALLLQHVHVHVRADARPPARQVRHGG